MPLVLNSAGNRLAKRDGAVSLSELARIGISPAQVLGRLAESLGLADVDERLTPAALLSRFDPAKLPTTPWVVQPQAW